MEATHCTWASSTMAEQRSWLCRTEGGEKISTTPGRTWRLWIYRRETQCGPSARVGRHSTAREFLLQHFLVFSYEIWRHQLQSFKIMILMSIYRDSYINSNVYILWTCDIMERNTGMKVGVICFIYGWFYYRWRKNSNIFLRKNECITAVNIELLHFNKQKFKGLTLQYWLQFCATFIVSWNWCNFVWYSTWFISTEKNICKILIFILGYLIIAWWAVLKHFY